MHAVPAIAVFSILLSATSPSALRAALQQPSAAIEGTVLGRAGEPVQGAEVRLINARTGSVAGALFSPSRVATTDNAGRYSFATVPAGTYRIYATARGFAQQEYGQTSPSASGTPISLSNGETLRDIVLRLTPLAVLTGRILDETRQPAAGVSVTLFDAAINPVRPGYRTVATVRADQRGEYRFTVQPGRYYLGAGRAEAGATDYAFQLHPGVVEIARAVPIDLGSGAQLTLDMSVQRRTTYRVRGTVVEASTGKPPASLNMSLITRTMNGSENHNLVRDVYDAASGRFELTLGSGSYLLQAQTQTLTRDDASVRAAGEAAWAVFPTARVAVVVSDRDVDGVVLTLRRPPAVAGTVRVEGGATLKGTSPRVMLVPTVNGMGWMPPTAVVSADGTFRVIGVVEGEYTVRIQSFPPGLYISSIQFDGADILNEPWRVSGDPSSGIVEIVLAPAVAQITGVLRDARSSAATGHVVLVPEKRSRHDLYRQSSTDRNGRFLLDNVAPGRYKLFGFEGNAQDIVSYHDPVFLSRYAQQGSELIVEGTKIETEVRVSSEP